MENACSSSHWKPAQWREKMETRIVSAPMPAPLERSGGGSCALTGAAGNRSRAENVLQHNKYALRITRNGRNYP